MALVENGVTNVNNPRVCLKYKQAMVYFDIMRGEVSELPFSFCNITGKEGVESKTVKSSFYRRTTESWMYFHHCPQSFIKTEEALGKEC